jgi:hypothetical protein
MLVGTANSLNAAIAPMKMFTGQYDGKHVALPHSIGYTVKLVGLNLIFTAMSVETSSIALMTQSSLKAPCAYGGYARCRSPPTH